MNIYGVHIIDQVGKHPGIRFTKLIRKYIDCFDGALYFNQRDILVIESAISEGPEQQVHFFIL